MSTRTRRRKTRRKLGIGYSGLETRQLLAGDLGFQVDAVEVSPQPQQVQVETSQGGGFQTLNESHDVNVTVNFEGAEFPQTTTTETEVVDKGSLANVIDNVDGQLSDEFHGRNAILIKPIGSNVDPATFAKDTLGIETLPDGGEVVDIQASDILDEEGTPLVALLSVDKTGNGMANDVLVFTADGQIDHLFDELRNSDDGRFTETSGNEFGEIEEVVLRTGPEDFSVISQASNGDLEFWANINIKAVGELQAHDEQVDFTLRDDVTKVVPRFDTPEVNVALAVSKVQNFFSTEVSNITVNNNTVNNINPFGVVTSPVVQTPAIAPRFFGITQQSRLSGSQDGSIFEFPGDLSGTFSDSSESDECNCKCEESSDKVKKNLEASDEAFKDPQLLPLEASPEAEKPSIDAPNELWKSETLQEKAPCNTRNSSKGTSSSSPSQTNVDQAFAMIGSIGAVGLVAKKTKSLTEE